MTTSNSNSTISLTTNSTSNGVVVVLEPYAIHIINSIVQDLTFLHQQGYIEKDVLDEISSKLPKPAIQKNKNTITSSPTSPVAAPQSPAPQSSAPSPKTTNSTMDSPVLEEQSESTNGNQRFPLPTQHEINSINAQLNQFALKNSSSQASLTNSTEGSNYSDTPLTNSPKIYPIYEQYEKRNTTEKLIAQRYQSSAETTRNNINENGIERHFDKPYPITLPNAPLAIYLFIHVKIGDTDDLAFQKGDKIEVIQCVNDEWWYGKIQGRSHYGIFPKIFTKILSQPNQLQLQQQKQQQQKQAIKSSNQPNQQIQYQIPARPISQVVYPNSKGQPLPQNGQRTAKRTSYPNYAQPYNNLQTINNPRMRPPTSNK
nr:6341_t:CDS:2 [Entrophospora candida]CAG8554317.1 10881_t:CDS:2 [Entrophospora candida]